jgi:hypothetical protein
MFLIVDHDKIAFEFVIAVPLLSVACLVLTAAVTSVLSA